LDEAAVGLAEEFDLLGCLDAFAQGLIAQFVAKADQARQEDARLALLGGQFG
jgi:hypothetical protein